MAQYTSISGLKLFILVLSFGFFAYILGPPLYWHFVGEGSGGSCAPCNTECPEDVVAKAAISDLRNITLPACPKVDADMEDEQEKKRSQKLKEEMNVQLLVAEEEKAKSGAALLEAKKLASQLQKDIDKCNAGMETTEAAREKAEESLAAMKKIAAMWEARAKKSGWKDDEGTGTTTDEERRETEESKTDPGKRQQIELSKNAQQVIAELEQNLAVADFLYKRAVDNEMTGVREARQHAKEHNLL